MTELAIFQRGMPNPWLHFLTVSVIAMPLLAASLCCFFLLFTRISPTHKEASPVSVQIVNLPPAPPKPVPTPPRRPSKPRLPMPMPSNIPVTVPEQPPPPPDTESPPPPEAPPAPAAAAQENANPTGTTSAYAISKPKPEIPAELRRQPMNVSVMVKFAVGADGSVAAELIQATPNPKLNQWLLETFRRWRFFPAIHFDQPVKSELIITVPIKIH